MNPSIAGLAPILALTLGLAAAPAWSQTAPAPTAAPATAAPATSAPAAAAAASTPAPAYGAPIDMARARAILDRAVAAAEQAGFRMAVAIVEPSGELVAFARMDDTQYGSIHVAQKKAWSAARYRQATSIMEQRVLAGRLVSLANEDTLPIAGGIPIVIDGRIVGAIGVSGASAAQDDQIAVAALTE